MVLSQALPIGGCRCICDDSEWSRVVFKILYWLAVVAISLALVVGLILWFESQDQSSLEGSGRLLDPWGQLALEAGEGHDSLRGAVERMAGAQHQPVVAAAA